jgi:glucose-1-phosphatase
MNILFDIGRVLLDFDFESSLARLLPPDTENPSERLKLLIERKDEFETGKIDIPTYTSWALQVLASPATPEEFQHAWQQIFTRNTPMWTCVEKLVADGHRLILFSNINGIHWPWITENFDGFHQFHGAVLSYETGFIKPQPEIYHHAIRTHQLVPEETLYIDDLPPNIATGIDLGFICHQYDLRDHAAFEKWLAANLTPIS